MADAVTPEKPVLEAKHFAAGLVDRTSLDREVAALQTLRVKKDGQAVFTKEIEVPSDSIKEPDFKELNDIALEVDNTLINPATGNTRQTDVKNSLFDLENVVKKGAVLTPRQLQSVGEVASGMPGIVKSIAKDTGLTEAQVKIDLKAANASVVPIITELCQSEQFLNILSNNIGTIEVTKQMLEDKETIKSLKEITDRERTDIDNTRKKYTNPPPGAPGVKEWYETGLTAPQQLTIRNEVQSYSTAIQTLNDAGLGSLQRVGFASAAEANIYKGAVDLELQRILGAGSNYATMSIPANLDARLVAKHSGATNEAKQKREDLKNKVTPLLQAHEAAEVVRGIYAADIHFATNKQKYEDYLEMPAKLTELKGREDQLTRDKAKLTTLQAQQGKEISKVAGKVERVMEKSLKEYYNKVLLKRAQEIAEYDAQQKTELKQKEADLKAKREEVSQVLLDKYLRMSFLKYQGGNPVGWDDQGLKKLVKEDLFAHSPADMGRQLLQRVYDNRGDFPDTYKKEIDALVKDMGVGAGPPRVTFRDVLKKMDTAKLTEFAAAEMPKAFGYAKARGYYFDRLRLKKHQVEYITSTDYGEGFFEKMLESAKVYAGQMDNEKLRSDVFRSIDVALKQLRDKTLGKDYQEGIKNALKVATIAGAATAGVHFIGGTYTLGKMAAAVRDSAIAAGAVTTLGVRNAADFVDTAAVHALRNTGLAFTPTPLSTTQFKAGLNSNIVP